MKKKSIFLFLSMIVLGVCSALGFFNIKSERVQAESDLYIGSTTASEWNGEYENEVDETDFFTISATKEHHILTARGFGFFAQRVTSGLYPFIDEKVFLDCDIDLAGKEWKPIGYDDGHAFKGTFDGQGHSIYNLKISQKTSDYAGLFGFATGSISNLCLKNVDIKVDGARSVGALAGNLTGNVYSNISVSGEIVANGATYVGGVIGESSTSALRNISNIMSDVVISATCSGTGSAVGGVFGRYAVGNGVIENVAFKGSITKTTATYAAGILGQLDAFSNLRNSYNVGSVSNSGVNTAGLVGYVNGTSSGNNKLSNLYNAGELTWQNGNVAGVYTSGLFGLFAGGKTFNVVNCVNLDRRQILSGDSQNFPLYRNANNATINATGTKFAVDQFATNLKDAQNSVRGLADMARNKGGYSNTEIFPDMSAIWDFENVWEISSGINGGLPYLLSTQNLGLANNDQQEVSSLKGEGTFENPFLIETAADLGFLSSHYVGGNNNGAEEWRGKYYSLQNDIDLTGKNWQPIGYSTDSAFTGVFDGNGHAIVGMTCSLQFKYSYHGLFGVTDGAVIKNLEIRDPRFINGGAEDNIVGALVGYAAGNTYIVNCKVPVKFDEQDLIAVGKADNGTLTIAYGKNNLVGNELTTLAVPSNATTAYDVEVEGNGGTFYDEKGKVVRGSYHVVVGEDGNIIEQNIDVGFKKELPSLSEKFGSDEKPNACTLIRRGYKLQDFIVGGNKVADIGATSVSASNMADLISGIIANYGKQNSKNVQVVYNQYEVENFGATSTNSYLKSDVFEVEYDSILSLDYPQIFRKDVKKDGDDPLRGTGFSIAGFYFRTAEEGLFDKEVDETAFANNTSLPNPTSEVYVKWVGNTETKYQLKVMLGKTDDVILGRFGLLDAIESVSLQSWGDQGTEFNKSATLQEENGKVVVSFDFDSTHSDMSDNGVKLSVKLKGGYEFSQNVLISDFDGEHDFGHLAFGSSNASNIVNGEPKAFNESVLSDGLILRNLVGEYTINITLQRKTFSTSTNVSSEEVFFAIAPNIPNVEAIEIYPNGFGGDPSVANPTTKLLENETYLGFDAINQKFVSGLASVGSEENPSGVAFDFNFDGYDDILLGYRFLQDGNLMTRYFKIVKEINDASVDQRYAYSYFEVEYVDGTWLVVDLIAKLYVSANGDATSLTYLMASEFSIIGSVKDNISDTVISKDGYDDFGDGGELDGKENANTEILVMEESGLKKLRHAIKIEKVIDKFSSQIGFTATATTDTKITLISKYTKVSIDLKFVEYVNGEKREIVGEYAPKVILENGTNYQLPAGEENQSIPFKFVSSDFYRLHESKFDDRLSVVLSDGIDPNILITAETVALESGETDNGASWKATFNATNSNYFGGSWIVKKDAVKENKSNQDNYDTYTFSIVFGGTGRQPIRAGRYLVEIICDQIEYALNFDTKFVQYKQDGKYTKKDFTTESGNGAPSAHASVKAHGSADENYEMIESGFDRLSYNSDLKMETGLGAVSAYSFFDWYVEGELWSGFLSEINREWGREEAFEFSYSQIYDYFSTEVLNVNKPKDYTLSLSAIYVRKEIHISFPSTDGRVSVAGQDVYVTARSLGLEISVSSLDYSYAYETSISDDVNWNLNFAKSGTNGDSYYFSGFVVLNASNAVVKRVDVASESGAFTDAGVFKNNYSIKSFVIDKLENDETLLSSTSYTIVPMVTRKTANLFVVSGTGNGIDGAFTDGKNGDVFYRDGDNKISTTNTIVEIGNVNVGDTLYLNFEIDAKVDGGLRSVVVDRLFAERTGYSAPANGYWSWSNGAQSGQLNGSQLYIASSYFDGTSEDNTSINLVVYKTWIANSYTITFARNQGMFGGDNASNENLTVTVYYDSKVENALTSDDISRIGHSLSGWTYEMDNNDQIVFDADGQTMGLEGVFDAEGNYVSTGNLYVYALWTPKNYVVQLVTNGANTIAGEDAEETLEFEIAYGSTFADAFEKLGLSGGDNSPVREGFTFNEIYANGAYRQTITSNTIFSETLPSCLLKEDGSASIVLYIDWKFDKTYVDLSFENSQISRTYTANEISIFLAEYFKAGFNAKGYVIEVVDDQTISISMKNQTHTSVTVELVSSSLEVSGNSSFAVRNVGRYNVSLVLTIVDDIGAGEALYSQTINLFAQVEAANLSGMLDGDNEGVWLANVKRLMADFVSDDTQARLENCYTFTAFVNNIAKSMDNTIPSNVTNKQVYEFVAYKYYYMITSAQYSRFKQMTYADFVKVKEENGVDVENVLERVNFFDFFDHKSEGVKTISMYNSSIQLTSSTVENPNVEVLIDRVEIVADSINVDSMYYFRAVIKNSGEDSNLNNYALSFDENGEAYIYLGRIYIMPELFLIESETKNNSTYYNANVLNVTAPWQDGRIACDVENFEEYFKIDENLFARANLFTSNLGNERIDTDFNFLSSDNFLYFDNLSVYEKTFVEEEIVMVDVTNKFKFVLDKNYVFTILNIDGVASIEISAKYLSYIDGFMTFADLPASSPNDLLKITQVTYDFGGGLKRIANSTDGLQERAYEEDGNIICQVEKNNCNTVSIILSKFAKSVTVMTNEKSLTEYIALYKWADNPTYNIDGTMENNTSFTINKDSLEESEGGLSTYNFYAVYTDMVLVNYNLNFPSNYGTSSPTTSWLKLGESTIDELLLPNESGFKLATLTLTKTKESYESIFDNVDGKFKGLLPTDRHAKVELEAKWQIEEMNYEQTLTEYRTSVYGFDYLAVSSVVNIYNKNDNLFNYSYEWFKGEKLLSKLERFSLEGNGTIEESGTYRLVVTANVKKEFLSTALVNNEGATSSFEVSFDLEFIKNKLLSITFAGENHFEYDSTNHMNGWHVSIEYAVYDPTTESYSENPSYAIEYFAAAKNLDFLIKRNGQTTSTMKDAGTYIISATGKEDVYSNAVEFGKVEFEVVVSPYEVELSELEIKFKRYFNGQEINLSKEHYLANENVILNFERQSGEDVGVYALMLSSISEDKKENYRLKMNGVVVFENGAVTTAGQTTKVGEFEIEKSGTLTLSYEVTDSNPETIEVSYSADGYRVELDGWTLKIFNGENLLKSLRLRLFDETAKEEITRSQILQILSENFRSVNIQFFDTTAKDLARSSGTYSYAFSGLDEVSNYFSTVEFAKGYQFVIGKIIIDISTLGLNKIYNGKTIEYFTQTGAKIEDIDAFDGVYVSATYENAHVGTTRVDLSLHDTNDSGEVSNYQLSEGSMQATISKLSATLTAVMDKETFEYGEISLANLESHVDKNYKIVDGLGNDVSTLLASGYYNISFFLLSTVKTNASGFVYAGTYDLQATASFDDFNMTLKLPKIKLGQKKIEKGISVGQISILASESIADTYKEEYTITETGDTFSIIYNVVGGIVESNTSGDFYNLALAFNEYVNSSVLISIQTDNKGFVVKPEENLVYIVLDKTKLDKAIYNGFAYNFSVDVGNKQLLISNNGIFTNVDFSFVYANGGASADDVVLSELEIFSGANAKSFADAGSYRLSFRATSSTHANFAFQEEYMFQIAKREVDARTLNLERTYSGSATFTIDDFDGKVGEDGVSLIAKFASANAGDEIDVSLFLQGAKSVNYELKNADGLKGKIKKAEAYVELVKTEFIYGNLTSRDSAPFRVISGGFAVSASQYQVTLTLENSTYSAVGYLECNTYLVSMSTMFSTNYNITFADNQRITVSPFSFSVSLATSGQFSYVYGAPETTTDIFVGNYQTPLNETIGLSFTREMGQEVGYYKVLSAMSTSKNYIVTETTDRSDGAFRILKKQDVVYILMSSSDVVLGSEKEISTITYDGNLYDRVSVVQKSGSKDYQLVYESSETSTAKQFYDLNFYSYNSETDEYTRLTDVTIDGLNAKIEFANSEGGRSVGEYLLNVQNATADNFSVVLGKYGLQSFYLNIEKRDVYFLDSKVSKVFDNQDAEIVYEDPTQLLDGILASDVDKLKLIIRIKSGDALAKYVGYSYSVEAELEGGTNYRLNLESLQHESLIGQILPAELIISVNNQTFVYGEEIVIDFEYSTEVDLNKYDRGMGISLLPIAEDDRYSTSGSLRVGEYEMGCILGTPDFKATYIVNGTAADNLSTATVTILKKGLSLEGVKQELEEIFTKTYDGSTEVSLTDESGADKLRLVGIVSKERPVEGAEDETTQVMTDDVRLENATYERESIGKSITINFTLGGTESDFENYSLASWGYGVIEPVVVGIVFNYNANGSDVKSNVETNKLPQLSAIAFPFMDSSTLTANSADAQTTSVRNFPTNLTGRSGYRFQKWTMSFKGEQFAEGTDEYSYLRSVLGVSGLTYVYVADAKEFIIDVSNNAETVNFLGLLLGNEADILGTYYKNHAGQSFTFDAAWEILNYQISVKIADEKGGDASFGKVVLDAGDGNPIEITSSYTGKFDYGTKITLLATPEEHCSYVGFYNATGSIYYDSGTVNGVTVTASGNGALLTVEKLGGTFNFVARFEADKVDVEVDLSQATDATISSEKFTLKEGGIYSWKATYLELENFALSDIGISREGFSLISISDGEETITDFENTKLSSLISEGQTTLILTPNFDAVGVVVTLDFADGKTENKRIIVPFKSKYSESSDWIETPTREGYEFVGWYDGEENEITGQSVLSTIENHTLTARWEILSFDLSITAENVTISSDSVDFVVSGNSYSLADVEFNTEVVFTVSAKLGYELTEEVVEKWSKFFDVTISAGVANVSLKMPAQDVVCKIASVALTNTITITGTNIGQILAYDVTESENPLEVVAGKVNIETGRTLKLIVSAEYGYQMIEEYVCMDPDAIISQSISNDVLTLTISNILRDISIELSTLEVINDVTIRFNDNDMISAFVVGGVNYKNSLETMLPFRVVEGENLEMYVKYEHGFEYDTSETEAGYSILCEKATEGVYGEEGYYKIIVSNIECDGLINILGKLAHFTIETRVLSYNELKQPVDEPSNKIFIGGAEAGQTSISVEYGSQISLSYQMHSTFNFAGWSKDGVNVFSTDENLVYTVEDNETIYAIFSSMRFTIRFGTYNNYILYSEYSDPNREREIYQEIVGKGEKYIDADSREELDSLVLYYGASKTISYVVPTGYRFYGFGYYKNSEFVMLNVDETDAKEATFTISSLELDEDVVNFTLYVIVKAYSFNININTAIDIDGIREENIDVGGAKLVGHRGEDVNAFGYVEGTRTRYSNDDFVNGNLADDRHFKVVGFTGENVYIKVNTRKPGYKFLNVASNSSEITISEIEKTDTYAIYLISGAIGGKEFDVDVLFKPNLNDIKIGFKLGENAVDGGAITYMTDEKNSHKVFASGRDYSSITVSAYTDSRFEVFAYVRTGFEIDPQNIQIVCENDIIDRDSIEYTQLSITKDGFTGRVKFVVRDFLFENEIVLKLETTKYTVKFVEEGKTLAIVKDVEFGSKLNLNQTNEENIQIIGSDTGLKFVDGKLEFLMEKENYRFEGLFTSENGAGTMYIDANGKVLSDWFESGYKLNSLTSRYELTENAYFNTQTGQMEISLYVYWSYYKTRIKFNLVPDVNLNVTAQDMVSGVDYTNSWFYPTSKYYIEVAFNTNIYIKAPKINGYKFYKFIIKQRDINGNALEDVVTFSEEVPWSTNELDNIVECEVQIIYFAQIDVVVFGGEGTFRVEQESADSQAMMLNSENYVDTTKRFKLVAVYDENNFDFVRWNNITSGQSWWSKEWDGLQVRARTTLILNLQGRTFTMSFENPNGQLYDFTFGQVLNVITTSSDNNVKAYRLGYYSAGKFIPTTNTVDVSVGDRVTLAVSIDYGFVAIWNNDAITFSNYTDGIYYFDMNITDCPPDAVLRILPEFKNEILSVYLDRDFVEKDKVKDAIDFNSVSMAGSATFGGRKVNSFTVNSAVESINVKLTTNARYKISSIVVKNYDKVFANVEAFTTDKGDILLSRKFLDDNNIVGTVQIVIRYERILWEDHLVTQTSFKGKGTDEDPYQISSVEDLVLMMRLCNSGAFASGGKQYRSASYILMKDLDLSEKFWTPIGTIMYSFNGSFDFNKHRVKGVFNALIYDTVSYGGLFGVLSPNAVFVEAKTEKWYIYLIIGIVAFLVIVIVILIILAKRRKKRREKLATA